MDTSALGRRLMVFLCLGIWLPGCLPYSCQPQPNEALYPSDSLSRQVAEETPTDTLRRRWQTGGTKAHPLVHPRTVRFVEGGGLAVSDVERNSVFRFGADGRLVREIGDEGFRTPYLIGTRGDTLVVFNAESNRIDRVVDGRRDGPSVSYERPAPETLVYMLATDTTMYAKVVGQNTDSFVARLGADAQPTSRAPLRGPHWRYAGFLRAWGDTLVSLSGFRPAVDMLPRGFRDGTTPDSLALVGFDSPMLERRYAFGQGDVTEAPLLSPAAAPVGDMLFVLNLRPGWIQIDAYDRRGRLQRRLVERNDETNPNFYPLDLDARRTEDGYVFAVAIRSPEPRLKVLEWRAR
ncbi:hypothetical protein [Salinibacter ruber]|uniref:hypothetical protein n=1 Tax=Salinibacter ruber TaxID=146919 RepID=UPI00216937D7|nr:hypothetical protein [Salinibacter ruber]MCS3626307.1 hypothetical protein [Salinibacter ruber]MCS3633276.1 hypothetical protein [Salinibacter ruber]MCS3649336.1 hypothetical protein [Salinibacter ruber]MCS3652590.1 hypothetical protein [Salinibacter ruber]MCS3751230.1 hypothetical protein [Salinibacter ruber]